MPGYTVVKLLELNPAERAKERGIDARMARGEMGSRDLGVSHFKFPAGFRAESGHRHREQEEAYLIVGGSGQILVDGDLVELAPWDLVRVAPETVRAFAAGPDGLEVVAIGGPKPEGGDGELAEVSWPA